MYRFLKGAYRALQCRYVVITLAWSGEATMRRWFLGESHLEALLQFLYRVVNIFFFQQICLPKCVEVWVCAHVSMCVWRDGCGDENVKSEEKIWNLSHFVFIFFPFEIVNVSKHFCQLCDWRLVTMVLFHFSALLPHLSFPFEWKT